MIGFTIHPEYRRNKLVIFQIILRVTRKEKCTDICNNAIPILRGTRKENAQTSAKITSRPLQNARFPDPNLVMLLIAFYYIFGRMQTLFYMQYIVSKYIVTGGFREGRGGRTPPLKFSKIRVLGGIMCTYLGQFLSQNHLPASHQRFYFYHSGSVVLIFRGG